MDHGSPSRSAAVLPSTGEVGAGPEAGTRRSLSNIQVLRGAAALCVVVHHGFVYVETVYPARGFATPIDPMLGALGVSIFFAISGFLMARLVRETEPWSFLAHRVVRIFPAYLAVVAAAWALFTALGLPFGVQFLALTLAPVGPRSYPLNVEWTLVYETTFYVGLFLLALGGGARRLEAVALAWLAALAAAWLFLPDAARGSGLPAPLLLPLSAPNVPFAAGLLLPGLVARGAMRPWLAALAIPLVGVAVLVELETARWLLGLAAVLIVGAAVQARQLAGTGFGGRALIRFGDASYVLYLAHPPVMLLAIRAMPAGLPAPVVWCAVVAAAVGVAALLGPLDVRAYRQLRRLVDAAPARGRQGLVLAYLTMFFGATLYGSIELGLEARHRTRAEAALAVLPPEARLTRQAAEAALASGRARPLPAEVRGEADDLGPSPGTDLILGAWAVDPGRPDAPFHLAAYCGGRLVAIDRARRRRPDVTALPGLQGARGKRIGFRLTLPGAPCRAAGSIVAVLVDEEGRLGLLPGVERLEAAGLKP